MDIRGNYINKKRMHSIIKNSAQRLLLFYFLNGKCINLNDFGIEINSAKKVVFIIPVTLFK